MMVMMVRHGESEWNQQNRFCGWFDANLSETGIKVIDDHDDNVHEFDGDEDDGDIQEAHAGGKALKDAGYKFDVAHTSVLQVNLLMFTLTLKLESSAKSSENCFIFQRAQTTLKTVLSEIGQPDLPTQKVSYPCIYSSLSFLSFLLAP